MGTIYRNNKPYGASIEKVPTKTSDLINDSDYQTQSQVSESINNSISPIQNSINTEITNRINGDNSLQENIDNLQTYMDELQTMLDNLKLLVPTQASESNQLADKNFVNSSIQTNTANFRGNWNTWEEVPTDPSLYPSDYAGSKTPTENDYMVVQDASSYGQAYKGTWRFKYSGNWAEVGKNGWHHEYQVNETPLTTEQLATLNSGLTATNVIKSDGANATSNGVSSMLNQLTEGTSDPQDNDYYISQSVGGGTTTTTYHRRSVKHLWNYIKGKISSVLGLTAVRYGGTSNKATSVVDYGDTNKAIKIGYAGSELTTVTHLAGYGSDGTTIKDITLSNVKKAMYIPATKMYGSMNGTTKYVTLTFSDTYGGILITTGYRGNLWFESNKGAPYAFSSSTSYGVTGYAWSSNGMILYLRLEGYRPITVTIPSFYEGNGRVTFGELSSTAPSGVTFLTTVNTIASNAVSYNAQSLTDAQKTQARSNIGAGTSSFSGSYNDLSNKPTIPTSLPIKLQGTNGWTTETDTVVNWASKGSVIWWIDKLNQIKDQPAQYGIILNLKVKDNEVRQLWFTQADGGIYERGGNYAGWAGTWRKLALSSEIPSISGCATTTDSRNAYRATHIPTSRPDSNVGAIWIS